MTSGSAIETIHGEAAGLKALVTYDQDAGSFSPRGWDNAWLLLGFKSRHRAFGDEQIDLDHLDETAGGDFRLPAYLREHHGARLIVPVSYYEHGLVRYYAGTEADRWDGGAARVAVLSAAALESEFEGDAEKARARLDAELETYTDWCNGSVYSVVVEDGSGDVLDSLGDIYGLEHARAEAKAMLGACHREWLQEQAERRYWAERDVETVER